MQIPPAIIFINHNFNATMQKTLELQLNIDETMSSAEFDQRVSVFPDYPQSVHLNQLRIMVVRDSFTDYTNRTLADVVIYLSKGLAYIEQNNFGPPGLTLPVETLNIWALLRGANSTLVPILPNYGNDQCCAEKCCCRSNCGCGGQISQGLTSRGWIDPSGVHCANPDNIYNNPKFLNRP